MEKQEFDARALMLDRPNEWVAAYFNEPRNTWMKVGFDYMEMIGVEAQIDKECHVSINHHYVIAPSAQDFDKCIPIENAPKGE